jgi:hypothetical protein
VSTAPIPCVCAWCARVRTDPGDWKDARSGDPSRSVATHGICPECLARETSAVADAEANHS